MSQQLDIIADGTENGTIDFGIDAFETGNFSTSHSMFGTAFTDGDALFQRMKDYRTTVANRFASENPTADPAGFGENSQQVLLPAFIAAYSGKDPNTVKTGLFRNIPIPNWTLRYNGLMKLKFSFARKSTESVAKDAVSSSTKYSAETTTEEVESPSTKYSVQSTTEDGASSSTKFQGL